MLRRICMSACFMVAFTAARGAPSAPAPFTTDQATILASVKAYALEYSKNLPNFICTQITHREITTINPYNLNVTERSAFKSDAIEEKLTYFNQKENYEVVAINGEMVVGVKHSEISGAISTGEFGSQLEVLFDPQSRAEFSWGGLASLRGRRVDVFAFHVPAEAGTKVVDRKSNKNIRVPYNGRIFVDEATKQVLQITTHLNLPRNVSIVLAEREVEYRDASIAGKSYNLPFRSEVRMREVGEDYFNRIEFKNYQKFAVESRIIAGNVDDQTPPDASAQRASSEPAAHEEMPAQSSTQTPDGNAQPAMSASSPAAKTEVEKPLTQTASAETAAEAKPAVTPSVAATLDTADAPYQLKLLVDMVLVPVVVRDPQGQVFGNLIKENFELYDKVKRQEIKTFAVETQSGQDAEKNKSSAVQETGASSVLPTKYVVYLIDDIHFKLEDLAQVRAAAIRHINTLMASDRAAIVTTSEEVVQDFTNDRGKLTEALAKLRPHSVNASRAKECPDVTYLMAEKMLNDFDPRDIENNPPLQTAIAEARSCMYLPSDKDRVKLAVDQALMAAQRAEAVGEQESRSSVRAIRDALHSIAKVPGKRSVILVSPGFILNSRMQHEASDLVDEAIRGGVIISALDARGRDLQNPMGDVQQSTLNPELAESKPALALDDAAASLGVLEDLAEGTGGAVIRHTNDLYGGLQHLAAPPNFIYVLGFKPNELKLDGSIHPLKVKLKKTQKLNVQARRGYYAAKQ
jgi:VWFA-related protein